MPAKRPAASILLVDDDPTTCEFIVKLLKRRGYDCTAVQSGAEAFQAAQRQAFDLLLLDLRLPDTDGLQLLQALREQDMQAPAIVITAHPSLPTAIEALGSAVSDYLPKPFKAEQLAERICAVLLKGDTAGGEYLWKELAAKYGFVHVPSRNPQTQQTYLTAARVASSRAPVLIYGESGTGKEFLAKAIHYLSDRADKQFVPINCGAVPPDLLESELFGHEKGAFTSASTTKRGLCEAADQGTLFLDEIGEMSLPMQVKLLRFLQDGSFRRLGCTEQRTVDVRIVAATNQNLGKAVREGRFREDLYWRINVINLYLPPLRKRPEDIEAFSRHFLEEIGRELDKPRLQLTAEALEKLRNYEWPGNIRQLRSVLLRAALTAPSATLTAEHVVFQDT